MVVYQRRPPERQEVGRKGPNILFLVGWCFGDVKLSRPRLLDRIHVGRADVSKLRYGAVFQR